MLLLALAATLQATSVEKVLNAFINAERSRPKQALTIVSASTISGRQDVTTYRLAFVRPTYVRLDVLEKSGSTRTADRVFVIEGARFTAYDRILNQVLTRKVRAQGSLAEKLSDVIGQVDEPVAFSIDADAANQFASRMGALAGWKQRLSHVGANVILSRVASAKGQTGSIQLVFSRLGLPVQMDFASEGRSVRWSFNRMNTAFQEFHAPASARRVAAFYERAQPPVFADEATKHIVLAAVQAYDQIRSLEYRVKTQSETSHVIWQGNSARQDDPVLRWSYHAGVLSIYQNKTGKRYRGRAALARVADYLNGFGDSIDPTLRRLLSGRNPIEVLFTPRMKAQTVAQSSARGVTWQVVELSSPILRIQVQFRSNSELPAGYAVENLDPSGRVISQSEHDFEYLGQNKHYGSAAFDVLGGASTLPLPALKSR